NASEQALIMIQHHINDSEGRQVDLMTLGDGGVEVVDLEHPLGQIELPNTSSQADHQITTDREISKWFCEFLGRSMVFFEAHLV
ncbi:hypothetical protein HDU93_005026, partial [Gonapodya sp. JEL0774]